MKEEICHVCCEMSFQMHDFETRKFGNIYLEVHFLKCLKCDTEYTGTDELKQNAINYKISFETNRKEP